MKRSFKVLVLLIVVGIIGVVDPMILPTVVEALFPAAIASPINSLPKWEVVPYSFQADYHLVPDHSVEALRPSCFHFREHRCTDGCTCLYCRKTVFADTPQ